MDQFTKMPAKKSHAHTIRTLEENIGKTLSNINHSHVFLPQFPKAKEVKAKARKWELIKLKKAFAWQRKSSTKQKDHLWNRRKYLQIMQSTKG